MTAGDERLVLAREIRVAMIRRGMTRQELAERTGITVATLNRRMRGDLPFTVDELRLVAGALGIGVAELLGDVA